MRDFEAQAQAIVTLVDVVERLVGMAIDSDPDAEQWGTAAIGTLARRRRDLLEAIPARLIDACGGSEEAAARVLAVLERSTAMRVVTELGSKSPLYAVGSISGDPNANERSDAG